MGKGTRAGGRGRQRTHPEKEVARETAAHDGEDDAAVEIHGETIRTGQRVRMEGRKGGKREKKRRGRTA